MITIWPQYLNKNLTLKEGRKIAKEDAVSDPTISDIERAVKRLGLQYNIQKEVSYPGKWYEKRLGLQYNIQKEVSYPGQWYEKSGRILVEWEGTKLELIREVSLKIKEMRN